MRRKTPPIGPVQRAINEAILLRAGLIADGNSVAESDRIVGQGLKAVLENPRPDKWHFLCRECRDTGWIEVLPSGEQLAQAIRLYGPNPQTQSYYAKCDPCAFLAKERREKRERLHQTEDEAVR